MKTIVIAYTEDTTIVVSSAGYDLGRRPKTKDIKTSKALVWLLKGGPADVVKAQAYAAQTGGVVFTYDVSEDDPLGRAKREVLAL